MRKILVLFLLILVVGCTPAEQTVTLEDEVAEVPPADIVAEVAVVDEVVVDEVPPVAEPEEISEPVEDLDVPKTHIVEFVEEAFDPETITIKVGDTIRWVNVRGEYKLNKAMVIGPRSPCKFQSAMLSNGEFYEWTFEEAGSCTIVDGYLTTTTSKVIIG